MGIGIFGIGGKDLPVARLFFAHAAERTEHHGPVALHSGIIRTERQRALELGHRFVVAPLTFEQDTQTVGGLRMVRRDGERGFKAADRIVFPSGVGEGHAHAGKGTRMTGVDVQTFFVAGERSVDVSTFLENQGQFIERRQRFR